MSEGKIGHIMDSANLEQMNSNVVPEVYKDIESTDEHEKEHVA